MRQSPTLRRLLCNTLVTALFALPGAVQASGFALIEQGASGMGNAFAGGSAIADDATTVFFNPAGMTRLKGTRFTVAGHVVSPELNFDNNGTGWDLGGFVGGPAPVSGGDGGEAGLTGYVPNLYFVGDITDTVKFGMGLNVPFGLATEYDRGWVGRYHALDSELHTINLNPSLSWAATDKLSLGLGVNVQYVTTRLTQMLDFATVVNSQAMMAIYTPMTEDGHVEWEGDDWSLGFNLGLLYEFNDATRVGLAYRSRVKHTLDGDADFTNTSGGTALPYLQFVAGAFLNSNIEADVTLPDSLSLSLYHQLNPKWAVMGDITWTNWSLVDEVVIQYDTGLTPDSVLTLEWEDTLRYALGVSYMHNNQWTWRFGAAFDESPTPNAELRTPRVPDADRIWASVGFNYKHSDGFSVDVGYSHLWVDDAKINNTSDTLQTLRGEYEASVDILSAQLNWTF